MANMIERHERLAAEQGVEIEYIQCVKSFHKEDRIQQILAARGTRPGLVHIFSAMEPCPTYEPWHDKRPGNKPAATLGRELRLVQAYLELMHMRMPDRLRFALHVDELALALRCPPTTLLTLVENAVRNGIDPSEEGGSIDIEVRRCGRRTRDWGRGSPRCASACSSLWRRGPTARRGAGTPRRLCRGRAPRRCGGGLMLPRRTAPH